MKERAKRIIKNPLIFSSSILVIGTLGANFFNFLFNIVMVRNLSVSDYGVLAIITSIIVIPALCVNAVSPMVVQFAGSYFAHNQLDKVRGLYIILARFFFVIGVIIFILFLAFINTIANFFQLTDISVLYITDVIILLMLLHVINNAFLQAKLAFSFQVSMNITSAVLKLILGYSLVIIGFKVMGGVYAILLAVVVAYLLSFYPIRFIFDRKISPIAIKTKELFTYGIPSALTLFGLTSLISADIILAKHFFDGQTAGYYAGLALVSKIIFYISSPIGTVMFPLIVQQRSKNENFTRTFKLSLLLVFAPSVGLALLYFLFPEFFVLFIMKQQVYLTVTPYLGLFGLYISLYCVLSLLATFYLSINKTKIYIPILSGAVLQVIGIWFFHETFWHFITISLGITFLLVLGLLLYYPYATKKRIQN